MRAGMRLGEALSRCPALALVPPDPERAAERLGAGRSAARGDRRRRSSPSGPARRSSRPTGCAALWGEPERRAGAQRRGRSAIARRGWIGGRPDALLRATPPRSAAPARAGAAARSSPPARRARLPRRPPGRAPARSPRRRVGRARRWPTRSSGSGSRRWASWRRCRADAVADRFGPLGLRALRLARGEDDAAAAPPARTRSCVEALELPEAAAGEQLERALELLVDRLLAAPGAARPHAARAAARGAARRRRRLADRGRCCGRPTRRPRAAAAGAGPKLEELPGAGRRRWRCGRSSSGPAAGEQLELTPPAEERRRERLGEAVRQVRAAAGPDAVLRVLEVDPASRVPERWAMLTPFPRRALTPRLRPGLRRSTRPRRRRGRGRRPTACPRRGRRCRGRGGPRGVAGRGPLVDAEPAAPPLLRARRSPTAAAVVVFREPRAALVRAAA